MTFSADVLDAVQDPLVCFDANWKITWVNEALEGYSGFSRDLFVGLPLWETLPQLRDTPLEIEFHRAMRDRVPIAFEVAAPFRMGDVLMVKAHPAAEGLAVTFRNVTALLKSQNEAQARLTELEAIYDSVPIGLALIDRDLRYVRVNSALAAIHGFPAEAHAGQLVGEVLPDVEGRVQAVMRQVFETGVPYKNLEVTAPIRERPDVNHTLLGSVAPVRTPSGDIQQIQVTVVEITELKQAEASLASALEQQKRTYDRLAAREAALRQSEQSLRAIFDASSEGLTLCRLSRGKQGEPVGYDVLDANPARDALIDQPRDLALKRRVMQTAHFALAAGQQQSFEMENAANGRWLEVRISPVVDDLFVETVIDMTSRREMERQREQLLTEMNHRVKNNFQMVASLLELQARRSDHPDVREQLHSAVKRVHVLADLHVSLANDPNLQQIDFGDYLAGLCEKLNASIEDPARVRLRYDGGAAQLPADKAIPLGFVVNELVTNAIKYAFPGDTAGEVTVGFSDEEDGFHLTVFDNGQGLPADANSKGSGLGMRLVRTFVSQAGGVLEISTDDGTYYGIHLPPRDDDEDDG